MPIIYMSAIEVKMSENFFNNSFNSGLNRSFGFNIIPERTMKQVKESAVNLLKDVVKPLTEIGTGKEGILDGSVQKQLTTYNKIINAVNNNMSAADAYAYRSLDIKS